jgi:endonuclease-3
MDLFTTNNDWKEILEPIVIKYKEKKHPLNYQNTYQLLVMVVLSAQDSDANINKLAPSFFTNFPNIKSLSQTSVENLASHIITVKNYNIKANWLIEIARALQFDENIPTTMIDLLNLKGIGRKSANLILHELKMPAEGIICDLHVIRVAPRLGLTIESNDGNKIEKELMRILPKEIWNDIGMALSFLGRETCRPTNPKHDECLLKNHCKYYLDTL